MASTRVTAADVQITGVLDMQSNSITGMETNLSVYPTQDDQAATKKYVDTAKAEIVASLPSQVNNGEY